MRLVVTATKQPSQQASFLMEVVIVILQRFQFNIKLMDILDLFIIMEQLRHVISNQKITKVCSNRGKNHKQT